MAENSVRFYAIFIVRSLRTKRTEIGRKELEPGRTNNKYSRRVKESYSRDGGRKGVTLSLCEINEKSCASSFREISFLSGNFRSPASFLNEALSFKENKRNSIVPPNSLFARGIFNPIA